MFSAEVRRRLGVHAMTDALMSSPQFVATYDQLSNTQYVDTLVANSGFAFPAARKNAWVAGLNNASLTRATVLLQLARDPGYQALVRNRWIVLSGYWAYMRRISDTAGFDARLAQLNAGGGNVLTSGLIDGFVNSPEHRQRFGAN